MILKESVEEEAKEVLERVAKPEAAFLAQNTRRVLAWLDESPMDSWNAFGPYWWNLADVLKNHAPREYREFLTRVGELGPQGEDEDIKKKFDYKNDLLNITAALMYLEERSNEMSTGASIPHLVEDENGEEKQYIPSRGFIEEEEF